jgi:hypothetical protein
LFPYWILFSVFAAGAFQYRPDPGKRIQGGPILLFAGLVAALMVGLRSEVGGDWRNYIEIFDDIVANGIIGARPPQDPGYTVLNWVVAQAGLGIYTVNLLCALLFIWGLVRFARRQPNPWLVMLVAVPYLIIVVGMGYTRQAVAIGFILAGLADFKHSSILRFSVYMLLSAAFHKSAVVVMPFVALTATRNKLVTGLVMLLSAALLYYLFVQSSIDRLMTNYVEQQYASQGAGIRVSMNLPPAIILLLFRKRFQLSEQESKLWRNFALAAFGALGLLIFTSSSAAVDRLALYLIPLQMFVLARLPSAFPERGRLNAQLVLIVIAYSAAIQFVWLNYADNAWAWLPYRLMPLG